MITIYKVYRITEMLIAANERGLKSLPDIAYLFSNKDAAMKAAKIQARNDGLLWRGTSTNNPESLIDEIKVYEDYEEVAKDVRAKMLRDAIKKLEPSEYELLKEHFKNEERTVESDI